MVGRGDENVAAGCVGAREVGKKSSAGGCGTAVAAGLVVACELWVDGAVVVEMDDAMVLS